MKRVFIVTERFDFDKDTDEDLIIGIYTTKELAESFVKCFSPEPNCNIKIKEQPVDFFKSELNNGLMYYFVRMTRGGKVYEAELNPFSPKVESLRFFNRIGFCVENNLYCSCFAKDIKDAIRICNEKRLQILAENRWPAPEVIDNPNNPNSSGSFM
jgi:hypothetical protein